MQWNIQKKQTKKEIMHRATFKQDKSTSVRAVYKAKVLHFLLKPEWRNW